MDVYNLGNDDGSQAAAPDPATDGQQGGGAADPVNSQPADNASGQQPPAPAQPAPAAAWNGQEWALKFRGRQVVPESREKLMNWAHLGYSYDQRAASLKEQEQQIAQRLEAVKEAEQLATAFKQNPEFKKRVLDFYVQSQQGGQQAGQDQAGQQGGQPGQQQVDLSGYLTPISQELQSVKNQLAVFQNHQADQALQAEIDSLMAKNPGVDWKSADENGKTFLHDVINASMKMNGIPLEVAFRHLYWDQMQNNARAEALAQQNAAKQAAAKKGQPMAGNGKPAPSAAPRFNPSKMSYDDIARQVVASAA